MSIRTGVSVLVLNEKGEVLLTQRHDLKTWVFPGGRTEERERLEQTAKREVEEEAGIKIKIIKLAGVYLNDHSLWKNINFFFLAKKIGGNLRRQKSEVLALQWVRKENLQKFLSARHYQRFRDAFSRNQEINLRTECYFPISLSKLPLFFWRRILGKRLGLVKM